MVLNGVHVTRYESINGIYINCDLVIANHIAKSVILHSKVHSHHFAVMVYTSIIMGSEIQDLSISDAIILNSIISELSVSENPFSIYGSTFDKCYVSDIVLLDDLRNTIPILDL